MKKLQKILSTLILAMALTFTSAGRVSAIQSTLFVKWDAGGSNNGTSWINAYTDLQDAIASANSGDEIWVATGTYKPGMNRSDTFTLKNGVAIYGGFNGTETSRNDRDPAIYITTLCGDIGTDGDQSDNSYHVVSANSVDSTAVLDGFVITAGNANNVNSTPGDMGGGMFNDASSPTLAHLIFSNNRAGYGGGIYDRNGSNPSLTNVTFDSNSSYLFGSGMYNVNSSPALMDVLFINNNSSDTINGGGMFNAYNSNPILMNVTFSNNSAVWDGGGMYNEENSSPTLTNVTFTGNSAYYGAGMHNLMYSSPILTNVTFIDNSAVYSGGGMLDNMYSSPSLTDVIFSNNSVVSGDGGGIRNDNSSNPTLTNVTFSGNSAAGGGGGILNAGSSNPSLINVTLSGNSAYAGGGMYNYHWSSPTLTNVTFSGNTATYGGGMFNYEASFPVIKNSVFWGDGVEISNNQYAGSLVLIDDTLIQGGCPAGATCNHILITDPLLGPLANYGGFTETIPVTAGSPVIDVGNDATCAITDQRGVVRPQGSHCDLGAYESEQITLLSQASYDGWVLESNKGSGKGGSVNISSTALYIGDNATDRQYRAILSFDTSTLPTGAIVTGVIIRLKSQRFVGANPFTILGNLQVDIRAGPFGDDPSLQTDDFQAVASQSNLGKIPKTPVNGWYSATWTSRIIPYINMNGLTQLRLRFNKSNNNNFRADYMKFYSGEVSSANRPQLIIYYYLP